MKKEINNERIVFCSGKRIILRPIMRKDVKKCLVWMNDLEITQYVTRFFPASEIEEEEWIEKIHKRENDITLAIELKNSIYIGNVGIHAIRWKDKIGTIGICIGEKKYWGKGYGKETLDLIIQYAFNTLNLRKLCLSVFDFNKRAYKCYLKCGFKEEGRRKEQYFRNGKYNDEILMGIFRSDWIRKK